MGDIRDKLQKYLKKILSKIENAPQNQMKSDLRGRLSKKTICLRNPPITLRNWGITITPLSL